MKFKAKNIKKVEGGLLSGKVTNKQLKDLLDLFACIVAENYIEDVIEENKKQTPPDNR